MLDRFDKLQQTLLQLISDHETLCTAPQPDTAALAGVRWRIAQCGHARVKLMVGEIMPAARDHCSLTEKLSLDEFSAGVAAYQIYIADYVRHWSTSRMTDEWISYCSAAADFRQRIRARLIEESFLLRPILGRA